ncbi:hypothetical protein ACIRD9_42540 [Streptomyces violaceus]
MGFALAVLFIWLGCALLWVAAHGTQAAQPWHVFTQVTDAMRGGE